MYLSSSEKLPKKLNRHMSATLFGSAQVSPNSFYYQAARDLSFKLSQQGFNIVTGGGPGIMEAANKGALDAGGLSRGILMDIPDQPANLFCSRGQKVQCSSFSERKKELISKSEAFIFFPGGFGTLDELFELFVYIRTGIIKTKPTILFGKDFWEGLILWVRQFLRKNNYIYDEDLEIFKIFNTVEETCFFLIRELSFKDEKVNFSFYE
jgi:uncharacterized protein (TIGR00730 family)